MQRRKIHIVCSPHGGLATYVQGLLETDIYSDKKLSIFFNGQKSNKKFLLALNEIKENDNPYVFSAIKTHKLPNHNTIGIEVNHIEGINIDNKEQLEYAKYSAKKYKI